MASGGLFVHARDVTAEYFCGAKSIFKILAASQNVRLGGGSSLSI